MAQATTNKRISRKTANRPVHTIRYGAVRAAIWRNVVDNGNASRPMYNVTFSRIVQGWRESKLLEQASSRRSSAQLHGVGSDWQR
jgi:hypothetical protein